MKYILSIDQSTSASKAFLIDEHGLIIRRASLPHHGYYPAPGRVEHDAEEIYQNVISILETVTQGIPTEQIAALAISNQRETTVLWDDEGQPVCPAIVWQDVRGENVCQKLANYADDIHRISGLPLSPYFPAGKIRALFDEHPEIETRAQNGELHMGTIDSYLVYRLTGGLHVTDATNASRTQLMDLKTLTWSDELLKLFNLPRCMLPQAILGADGDYGSWRDIPITGVLGDSHAALFGQGCHQPGMAKATYGTGSSVMMNIGQKPIISSGGLAASVAFRVNNVTHYALEGNVTCSGDTLVWLCNEAGIFKNPEEIEALARTVPDSQGAVLVPAFSGLFAPYFNTKARGILCGLNRGTTKAHIAYAALESIAQQDADILDIMRQESGYATTCLFVDGGPTKNTLLMQLQADLANCPLQAAAASELSALGAAYIAGLKVNVFKDFDSISRENGMRFEPTISPVLRATHRENWNTAIRRALVE